MGGVPVEEGSAVRAVIPVGITRDNITVRLRVAVNNPTRRIFEGKRLRVGYDCPQ